MIVSKRMRTLCYFEVTLIIIVIVVGFAPTAECTPKKWRYFPHLLLSGHSRRMMFRYGNEIRVSGSFSLPTVDRFKFYEHINTSREINRLLVKPLQAWEDSFTKLLPAPFDSLMREDAAEGTKKAKRGVSDLEDDMSIGSLRSEDGESLRQNHNVIATELDAIREILRLMTNPSKDIITNGTIEIDEYYFTAIKQLAFRLEQLTTILQISKLWLHVRDNSLSLFDIPLAMRTQILDSFEAWSLSQKNQRDAAARTRFNLEAGLTMLIRPHLGYSPTNGGYRFTLTATLPILLGDEEACEIFEIRPLILQLTDGCLGPANHRMNARKHKSTTDGIEENGHVRGFFSSPFMAFVVGILTLYATIISTVLLCFSVRAIFRRKINRRESRNEKTVSEADSEEEECRIVMAKEEIVKPPPAKPRIVPFYHKAS